VQQPKPAYQLAGLLEVLRQDADHVVLTHGNLILLIWRGTPAPEACATVYDLSVDLARKCGKSKVSALSIIQPGARAPTAEARKALARLHDDPAGVVHRSALVFPSEGFLGATIRSIALGIRQLAGRRQGHDVFQRLDKALAWVTEGLETPNCRPVPVASLLQALDGFEVSKHSKVA